MKLKTALGHDLHLLPEVTSLLAQLGLIFGATFMLVELWDELKPAGK